MKEDDNRDESTVGSFVESIIGKGRNPDVLSCLANLSNDEVFTPPDVVNQMLDALPQSLFQSPETTFLDPFCKSGVFLREIAKRLIRGLEDVIPDLRERLDHIYKKQLYGIAITELTSLVARRTLYCSKYPNSEYSVAKFDSPEGNIRFRKAMHVWDKGRCAICGASEAVFGDLARRENKENYAYEFIHCRRPEEIFNVKFDVIVGNPPYQLNIGKEKENYAIPIYNLFVENTLKLSPHYITMIIPARWYSGGRGLGEFRKTMLRDDHIRIIHDFPDASVCFPGVQIKAGVCYFLWDRDETGDCLIYTHLNNEIYGPLKRPLLEKGFSTFIRYNQAIPIIKKVYNPNDKHFNSLVSTQTPFGLSTSYKGNQERNDPSDIVTYISGNDKSHKGKTAYTPINRITRGHEKIGWHKVYIGKAGSGSDSFPHQILSKPFYGEPNTVCNQSYLVIGPFPDKRTCTNVISYIKTKFFRFMVLQKKNSQDASREVYSLVPQQDFSKPWTDKELYKKYGLTGDDIEFIESMIRPME